MIHIQFLICSRLYWIRLFSDIVMERLCAVKVYCILIVLERSSRDRDSRKSSRKPYKYWDVPPTGFENMTPMDYKALQGKF